MAQRLVYHLLKLPADDVHRLAETINTVKAKTFFCSACQNITDKDPCALCSGLNRDTGLICVVQEPMDVLALEKTGVYKGLYHVLHGAIDPMNKMGPENLRIRELLERLKVQQINEIVLATSSTLEGEATALYLLASSAAGANETQSPELNAALQSFKFKNADHKKWRNLILSDARQLTSARTAKHFFL